MSIGAATEPRTVCGGDLRQRVLHSDIGRHNVRITIRTDRASRFYFLLHVEGERLHSFSSGLLINFVSPPERAAQGAAEGGLMFCLCFLVIFWRFLRLIISTSTGPIFTKYAGLVELLL